jgi:hypothetical protein
LDVEAVVDELRELLAQLYQRGLHGHISERFLLIVGGRSVSTVHGITLCQGGGFNISREPNGWVVRTDGKGQEVHEVTVATAEEVLHVIASAGRPPPAPDEDL